jgi:hypothetical protein
MKLFLSQLAIYGAVAASCLGHVSAQSSPDNSSHSMQQDSQPPSMANSMDKGQQKLTGCIRSDQGKYVIGNKLHKKIWLSGPEDFGPHKGHTVTLYGSYLNDTTSTNKRRSADASRPGSNFQVTKIDMVSNTCSLKSTQSDSESSPRP